LSQITLVKYVHDVFLETYKKMVKNNDKRIIKYINGEMEKNNFNFFNIKSYHV